MLYTSIFAAAMAASGAMAAPTTSHGASNCTTLDSFFKSQGKLYWGTAVDKNTLMKPGVADFVAKEFGQVTPENSMKFDATEPSRGQFHFDGADYLVDYAEKHDLLIRGHTFLWWSQMPAWVKAIKDKNTLIDVIQTHISTVAGRYKGKIYAWDVVNEIFEQDGSFRKTVYYNLLGEDYVRIAFEAAHKADPKAKLYINDFNLDDPNAAKLKAMIKYVTKWRAAGWPIHGIGSQSHLFAGMGEKSAAAIKMLGAAADEVAITELDITGAPQADYEAVTKGCIDVKNCVGITSWGVRDTDSWLASKSPLLFDANFKPKAAVKAIMAI
ncbi:Endo-1,4-beta-xylanase 2 [Claviceps sp. Clav32 group G5]|nr:Endo-1,4-beta-xylanase 2 [Claviceps sp. LM458 group G5]KAG6029075.1 Endo-1,4-beta-xylanase 2 [Claviceps sp. Clav32 group G5]KAG6043938.1 Endo-1,4-beta-xylanase 2 [Claviceps sp. Clav50 group G5]